MAPSAISPLIRHDCVSTYSLYIECLPSSSLLRWPGHSGIRTLARHRRVRRAGPTRLTDCRPLLHPCSNQRANDATGYQFTLDALFLLARQRRAGFRRPLFELRSCFAFLGGFLFSAASCTLLNSDRFLLLLISVCSSSSASSVRASIGISSFTRALCNELSRGGLSRGGRARHKTDAGSFVSFRISNVIRQFLSSAVAPLPSGVILHAV